MSDKIRLNIKSRNLKAVIQKKDEENKAFYDYAELLEKEKIENSHKIELETEYKKGIEIGKQVAEELLNEKHNQELIEQAEEFYKVLKTFEDKIKTYENNFHKIVINVSQKIAEKIIKREIEQKSIITEILEQNLSKVIGANEITIKLNSTEFKIVEKTSKEQMSSIGISKIRFEPSDSIAKGGCLIETEMGNLDARIDSQLNEILKILESKLTKSETE
ncbi:MAG: hypothetical protein IPH62_04095 [Ignavibacteriae bacterium]|nr:hypothetical protein [Ignavibacteriota bacterium]